MKWLHDIMYNVLHEQHKAKDVELRIGKWKKLVSMTLSSLCYELWLCMSLDITGLR